MFKKTASVTVSEETPLKLLLQISFRNRKPKLKFGYKNHIPYTANVQKNLKKN